MPEYIDFRFPFTEEESAKRCLKSALVVPRIARQLHLPNPYTFWHDASSSMPTAINCPPRYPQTLPYMACCKMQSFYALTMLHRNVRAALYTGDLPSCYHLLSDPQPESEVQNAERLIEELRRAIEFLGISIQSDAVFEGVISMAREVESVRYVIFPD